MGPVAILWFSLRVATAPLTAGLNAANQQVTQSMSAMAATAIGFYGAIYEAGRNIFSDGMKEAAEFEKITVEMETMIGTAEETQETLARLTQFAVDTPFGMPQLLNVTRQLITFGERGDELFATLKMLGDASGGTNEKFQLLGSVFNQVRGAGKLLTQDFRQLSGRGILSLKDIAKYYKITTQAADKMMSDGKISFLAFKKILQATTEAGGRFHNMMAKTATTLTGLNSTLKDSVEISMRMVATPLLPYMKGLVIAGIGLANTLGWIAKEGGIVTSMSMAAVTAFSGLRMAMIAGRVVMNMFGFTAKTSLGAMIQLTLAVAKMTPWLMLVGVLGAVIGYLASLKIVQDTATSVWSVIVAGVDKLTKTFKALLSIIKATDNVSIAGFYNLGLTIREMSAWVDRLNERFRRWFFDNMKQIQQLSRAWFAFTDNLLRMVVQAINAITNYWSGGTGNMINSMITFAAYVLATMEYIVDQFVFWTTNMQLTWAWLCWEMKILWLYVKQALVTGLYYIKAYFSAIWAYIQAYVKAVFDNIVIAMNKCWQRIVAYSTWGLNTMLDHVDNWRIKFLRAINEVGIHLQATFAGASAVAWGGDFMDAFTAKQKELTDAMNNNAMFKLNQNPGQAADNKLAADLAAIQNIPYKDMAAAGSAAYTAAFAAGISGIPNLLKPIVGMRNAQWILELEIKALKEMDKLWRSIARRKAEDKKDEKKKREPTPDMSVKLAAGRYGFSEIGNKIQDELLKGTQDVAKEHLTATQQGNTIQGNILAGINALNTGAVP